METDIRTELGFALGEATHLWRQTLDRRLRPLGLSQATWRTLFHLERRGEGISQRALAELMGIEGPSLVRLLDSLERDDLVERRPAVHDRRANTLHLTAKARPLLAALHRVADEVRNELLGGVDESELQIATQVLLAISANAERMKASLAEFA